MKIQLAQPEWIIQRCRGWKKGTTELIYEDWLEYSRPMTRAAALVALKRCNEKYPYEFRAHRLLRIVEGIPFKIPEPLEPTV
jgi:hypothetical protein